MNRCAANICAECGHHSSDKIPHNYLCSRYKDYMARDEDGNCMICGDSPYGCKWCSPGYYFVPAHTHQTEIAEFRGAPEGVGEDSAVIFPSANQLDNEHHGLMNHMRDHHGVEHSDSDNDVILHHNLHSNDIFLDGPHEHSNLYIDNGSALIEDVLGHQPHPNMEKNWDEMSDDEKESHLVFHPGRSNSEDINEKHKELHSLLNDHIDELYEDYEDGSPVVNNDHEHWGPSQKRDETLKNTQELLDELQKRKIDRNQTERRSYIEKREFLIERVLDTLYGEL